MKAELYEAHREAMILAKALYYRPNDENLKVRYQEAHKRLREIQKAKFGFDLDDPKAYH